MSLLVRRTNYDVVEATTLLLFVPSWQHFLFFHDINRPEKFLHRCGSNAIANLIFHKSLRIYAPTAHCHTNARFILLAMNVEELLYIALIEIIVNFYERYGTFHARDTASVTCVHSNPMQKE